MRFFIVIVIVKLLPTGPTCYLRTVPLFLQNAVIGPGSARIFLGKLLGVHQTAFFLAVHDYFVGKQ